MNIYEIEITDEHRSVLSSNLFDKFVVLAKDFDEAYKKALNYLKSFEKDKLSETDKVNLEIKGITKCYVIKEGL